VSYNVVNRINYEDMSDEMYNITLWNKNSNRWILGFPDFILDSDEFNELICRPDFNSSATPISLSQS
jgi:hypothetical protein